MTDTQSFRDVVVEATKEVETPKVEAPEVTEAATEVTKEQPDTEESFAEKGDLSGKTPEQLEEIYKNWQRSYTEKRQKETQRQKELEAKIAELESKMVQPAQTQQVVPTQEKAEAARQALDLGQMTVNQYTDYMRDLAREEARQVAKQEYGELIKTQHEEQLQSKAVSDFENADPRLNEHSPEADKEYREEVRREVAELLDKHLLEHGTYAGFDTTKVTKQIIEAKDKKLDELIKKRTIQSTQAAKMREAKSRKSEERGTTSNSQPVGGDSIRNILQDAVDSAA